MHPCFMLYFNFRNEVLNTAHLQQRLHLSPHQRQRLVLVLRLAGVGVTVMASGARVAIARLIAIT